MNFTTQPPVVLSFGPHDPSGASGIQADIEALSSLGCHCTTALSGTFAKDSRDVKWRHAIPATTLVAQGRAILEDMQVSCIKVGDLGNVENIEAVHSILSDYPNIPVVFDPTCYVDSDELQQLVPAYNSLILPLVTVTTLNTTELKTFSPGQENIEMQVNNLLASDCPYFLITNKDRGPTITNKLYTQQGCVKEFTCSKLDRQFQGAGSVYAAAIAGYLAHGADVYEAIGDGQRFLNKTLLNAQSIGMGDCFPHRLAGVTA